MGVDPKTLYAESEAFFRLSGSATMKLTPVAAQGVCLASSVKGYVVVRVEGGIWHSPGFEARVDCIWDGSDPPLASEETKSNNALAAEFVLGESAVHNAFIITVAPQSGYLHRRAGSPSGAAP
jgi:hypothetical protein